MLMSCFSLFHLRRKKKAEDVYVWDLDKTYLDTKFETIKE